MHNPPPGRPPMGPHGGHGPFQMTREKPKNTKKTFKRLLAYIGASKYLLIFLVSVMIAATLLSLAGPALQGNAIDAITLKGSKISVDFKKLYVVLFILGVTYLFSAALTWVQGILSAKLSQRTVRNLRSDLFSKIERLPIRFIDTHPHGDLMSRMTNDVDNVSNTVSQSIGSLISSVLSVIGSLALMLYYSPFLTLITFVTIPLSMFATAQIAKKTRKYFLRQQVLLGQLNGHTEEMVTGFRTVIAFGKEKDAIEDFGKISSKLKSCGIRAQIFGGIMGPVMNIIGNLSFLLIAGFGGYFALKGWITVGVIQAFILYSNQFTRPINEIANQYTQIQTAIAGAERVFEIIDTPEETNAGKSSFDPKAARGDISFENVIFSYKKDEPVLKGLNLNVKSGQKIAIVGATGAGKTTIVNLLTRFYEIDEGSIKIDGIDIRDIEKSKLRENVAIVLQDTILFSDTIGANIRYGRLNASDEEVRAAARAANADLFIERLPSGYQTQLAEAGENLSQGQRQLISIARAVLANPRVLILDEATSSVDTRTEMHIQKAMIALMKSRTSLIIAHRLSTIRDADIIVVIKNGVVAESGSHEELIEKRGDYWQLYQNQFKGIAI